MGEKTAAPARGEESSGCGRLDGREGDLALRSAELFGRRAGRGDRVREYDGGSVSEGECTY